jgi:hypothetical protein
LIQSSTRSWCENIIFFFFFIPHKITAMRTT